MSGRIPTVPGVTTNSTVLIGEHIVRLIFASEENLEVSAVVQNILKNSFLQQHSA